MAKVKKPLTKEQQLKALKKERAEIIARLEDIKARSERQTARLADVDAKIAALTTPLPPPDPVPA